jgi:hypothetical protein
MTQCPDCGKRFNLWQRLVGEYKEHVRDCDARRPISGHDNFMVANCRGCPAGCFEKADFDRK